MIAVRRCAAFGDGYTVIERPGSQAVIRAAIALAILTTGALWALIWASMAVAASAPSTCPNQALRTGASVLLPDCRAYEQVSPSEKGGYNAVNWVTLEPAQAAPSGERVFYQGLSAFPGAEGNSAFSAGHLSVRTEAGWRTIELTPHTEQLAPEKEGFVFFEWLSEDLSQVVFKAPVALTPAANRFAYNVYARQVDGEPSWTTPSYTWLSDASLPAGTTEMCNGLADDPSCNYSISFAGASADPLHVLFESAVKLAADGPANGIEALYEEAGGIVRPVGVLPDGTVAVGGATAGAGSLTRYPRPSKPLAGDRRVEHAISADGERVVFEAKADGASKGEQGQVGETEVYDRLGNATEAPRTIELSAPTVGATPKVSTPEPASFWAASTNGSRVFFTSSAELTTQSNTGAANNSEDLYEYNVETGTLKDLTVDTNPADTSTGAGVLGVVGTSEDGEYVYFVASGELVPGKGADGSPNLYMEHNGGAPAFIASLHPGHGGTEKEEEAEPGDSLDWTPYQEVQRAYVTPDGDHLGFMSLESLHTQSFPAGYDNIDLRTGKPDSEVYEYSAPTAEEEAHGGEGLLTCVSCDRTGQPPSGSAYIAGAGESVNGNSPTGAGSAFHHPRAISEDGGRVLFSAPPFASETTAESEETSQLKIYEYEVNGEGSCRSPQGCVFRLSAANNPTEDLFIDSSAGGEDVFLATYSQLAPSDHDHLIDVYDARVDGGFATPTAETCDTECREAPGAPPQGATPVSSLVGPPGNLLPPEEAQLVSKPKQTKKKTSTSCLTKAKREKNAKARQRAVARCRKVAEQAQRRHRPVTGRRRGTSGQVHR